MAGVAARGDARAKQDKIVPSDKRARYKLRSDFDGKGKDRIPR